MAEACKRATTAADRMHAQCSSLQKDNTELLDRLRQTGEKMKVELMIHGCVTGYMPDGTDDKTDVDRREEKRGPLYRI